MHLRFLSFLVRRSFFLALMVVSPALFAQRLPETVVPTHYTLKLTPDLKNATFTGVERIDVNLKQPADAITLNAMEIKFQSVTIFPKGPRQRGTVSLDAAKQQATLHFPKIIPAGNATIEIHFSGILNNELRGFYLSTIEGRRYAVTQFEPTDARRAFPCFDEPAFKARYSISLVIDNGDTAISNGSIVSDKPIAGSKKHIVAFSETPKMSTYLVAFVVGEFACKGGTSDGVAIRVCAPPDQVKYTSFALDTAKFALHYYNDYFKIPYPLKKLDLIAIPDFEAGAMENFGAITFRETALLLDPKTATLGDEEHVAIDIDHEMAHQWFGDMVTMEWWNNIWLNEGFATWMENKPVAAQHPEWKMAQLVAADEQSTLDLDARPTTRAIRAPQANTPSEINQLFDGISYGKASDVLLTVENYLGEETFRQGVHNYLQAHMFGNATAQDFWNTLAATSHKPVDKIMESLVIQPGEPILHFGAPADGKVTVSQQRFFLNPNTHSSAGEQWTLPVCFAAGQDQHDCELLTPQSTRMKIPGDELFYANAGGKGYYRSLYEPAQYKALVSAAESALSPAERISLSGDEWALVRADKGKVGDSLDLAAALKDDPNSAVMQTAIAPIGTIYHNVASNDGERKQLTAWVRQVFGPVYAKLGPLPQHPDPNQVGLRSHLFALLGYIGEDPAVLKQARQIAEQYLENPGSVNPTLAQTALAVAAEQGDAQLFDKLQKAYETSNDPAFKDATLRMLAEFKNPQLEERALNYAISGKVRNQDAAIQFAIALGDPDTREAAWSFIKSHWPQVNKDMPVEMGQILVESTGTFCSAAAAQDVQSFFAGHPVKATDVSLKRAMEHIDGCVQLRSRQEANLQKWLADHPE